MTHGAIDLHSTQSPRSPNLNAYAKRWVSI